MNVIEIQVHSTDKSGLDKLPADARRIGREMEQALGKPLEQTERKTRDTGSKMSSAMKSAVSAMSREMDKLEKNAALSGDGMSSEYAAALAVVRGDLDRVTTAAKRTGAGLEGELGDALRSVGKDIAKLRPEVAQTDKAFSEMARNTARLLDRIEVEANEAGDGIGKAMSQATRSIRADLERVEQKASQTGGKLDSELGQALRNIQADARKTRAELEKALSPDPSDGGGLGAAMADAFSSGFDISGLIEGAAGKAGMSGGLVTAGAAAGALYATAVYDAFQDYWKKDAIGGIIAAQQGGGVSEARALGRVTGEAYYSGVTDSVEESAEALSGVLSQGLVDTSATEAELRKLTNLSATAAKVVGEDAGRIARGAKQLLVNGLADNAAHAIDIITTASQKGVNVSGDLLDTLEEYAPQFARLGISGEQAMGLISQAMQAGARNSDIAADALKEFVIRAQDGTEMTARGFKSLGLDAGKMADDIAAGGTRAETALGLTLDKLRAIEDPVLRNQAAVDLFGTKAEDLGDSLYAMDLNTVAGQMGDVEGATQRAQDTIAATEAPTDKMGRSFEKATDGALGLGFSILGIGDAVDQMHGAWGKTNPKVIEFNDATDGTADSMDNAADSTNEYVATIDELISAQREAVTGVIDFNDAQIDAQKAIADANEAIKEYAGQGLNGAKNGFDLTTEAGQELSSKLLDVADSTWKTVEAMQQQGKSQGEVTAYVEGSRAKFVELAEQMGLSSEAAHILADDMFGIPLDRTTTVHFEDAKARARLRLYQAAATIATANRRTDVTANTLRASVAMANFGRAADVATRDRIVDVIVRGGAFGGLMPPTKASGGITSGIWGAQSGGQRHGSTIVNEAGPELIRIPDGSNVMTAGATMAMAQAGLLGGGGGGVNMTLSMESTDPLIRAILGALRVEISERYGGNTQLALGRN